MASWFRCYARVWRRRGLLGSTGKDEDGPAASRGHSLPVLTCPPHLPWLLIGCPEFPFTFPEWLPLPSPLSPNHLAPDLSSASSSWLVSTPSSSTRPALGSSSRKSTENREDLPEPVRPTMPSFSPGSTRKVTLSRAFGSPGRYTNTTSWNSTLPRVSHLMPW